MGIFGNMSSKNNPRSHNGNFRRKVRARFKAMGAPCHICNGRLGRIHYEEPSDASHPLSFVVDEIRPVSRWREFGYDSPEAACADISNLAAAHYVCNAQKSNLTLFEYDRKKTIRKHINISDGDW